MHQLSLFPDTNDQPAGPPAGLLIDAIVEKISLGHQIDAFYSPEVQEKRKSQRQMVYDCIEELIIASDREISLRTKLPRHLVPDRRGQLLKAGLIEVAREGIDPETGMKVTYYKISGNSPQ